MARILGALGLALVLGAGGARADDGPSVARGLLAQADKSFRTRDDAGATELDRRAAAAAEGDVLGALRELQRAKPLLEAVDLASWHPELWKDLEAGLRAGGGPSRDGRMAYARAEIDLLGLRLAIELYRIRARRLPISLAEAQETKEAAGPVGDDPWGRPYAYRVVDRSSYDLRSHGPDGEPGTEDDVLPRRK